MHRFGRLLHAPWDLWLGFRRLGFGTHGLRFGEIASDGCSMQLLFKVRVRGLCCAGRGVFIIALGTEKVTKPEGVTNPEKVKVTKPERGLFGFESRVKAPDRWSVGRGEHHTPRTPLPPGACTMRLRPTFVHRLCATTDHSENSYTESCTVRYSSRFKNNYFAEI